MRISAPTRDRHTAPSPPRMLVPPITTAAIAVSSSRVPRLACAEPARVAMTSPAVPAQAPLTANTATRTGPVLMPDSRAASALPPTAYTARPNVVPASSSQHPAATAARTSVGAVMPPSTVGRLSRWNASSPETCG